MNYLKLKKLRILFVDDDKDASSAMSVILGDFFASVDIANNGLEAFEIIKSKKPDILVTDILMPKLNGLELIQKLDKHKIRPSVVFIASAHSETPFLLEAIKLKVDGYLSKPLNTKDVLAQIIDATSKKEFEDGKKLIDVVSIFVGGKKIEIIKYLFENVDKDGVYKGSYEDLMRAVDVSKPTVVSTFKQLINAGLVERVKNKCYRLKS